MTTEPKKPITHSALRIESTLVIQPAPPPERSNAVDSAGGHVGSHLTSNLTGNRAGNPAGNPIRNWALQVAPALPPAFPPPKEPFARSEMRKSASREGR